MKTLLVVYFCLIISVSRAQTIYPGVKAPEIKVKEWVKGKPITKFATNQIYVVEFWATWCGPCKRAIPHLTSLAKKYKGKVSVIGVSVWEKNFNNVPPFVSHMGDQMAYNVAYDYQPTADPNSGYMSKNWLKAAELDGIPATFIVGRKGRIEYIGYPDASLDSVLQLVVNGKWDAESYGLAWRKTHVEERKITEQKREKRRELEAAWNAHPVKLMLDRIGQLTEGKNYEAALRATDSLEKMDLNGFAYVPPLILAYELRLDIYSAQGNKTNYFETFDKMLEYIVNDKAAGGYSAVNDVIWKRIVDPEAFNINKELRDYNFAIKWLKRVVADNSEKDPGALDTLAWAYFGGGDKQLAVATEQKALALVAADDPQVKEFEKALEKFQQ
jgi:thiol-disulfide isomerase/thioredoxin